MPDYQGTYHNGQTAHAFSCDLVLQDTQLYIYLKDANQNLIIWNLDALESCHLNGNHLNVKYGNYPHETLECSGAIAKTIYDAWSGKNVVRRAEGMVFGKNLTLILSICVAFIFICIASYLWILPWVGERSADLVPRDLEISMGEQMKEVYMSQGELNDSAGFYADEFANALELDTDYPIHVYVMESPEINAFALPGGNIVIYTGLLSKMDSYEQLAALLGHEITHVVNRHSMRSILRDAAGGILISTLFGDVTGVTSVLLAQADEFKQLEYSRDLETEADNNGLDLMIRNKIDPQGMLRLLELLKEESMEMPAMMKYLSTHPETQARIDNVNANPQINTPFASNPKLKLLFQRIQRNL